MNSLKEKVKAVSAKLQNIVNQSTQPKFAGQGRKLGSLADSGTAGTQVRSYSCRSQPDSDILFEERLSGSSRGSVFMPTLPHLG
jgi:hypothetical protein